MLMYRDGLRYEKEVVSLLLPGFQYFEVREEGTRARMSKNIRTILRRTLTGGRTIHALSVEDD